MQEIWDTTYKKYLPPYKITVDGPVFGIVSIRFLQPCDNADNFFSKTMQRTIDSWRTPIRSTAVASVNAFFLTDENHKDKTDEELKVEAGKLLEDWKFIFLKMEDRQPDVSCCLVIHTID